MGVAFDIATGASGSAKSPARGRGTSLENGRVLEIPGEAPIGTFAASKAGMLAQTIKIARVEFVGGPEDGRTVNSEQFRGWEAMTESIGEPPMPVAIGESTIPSDEEELELLGIYVIGGVNGSTLRYIWKPRE